MKKIVMSLGVGLLLVSSPAMAWFQVNLECNINEAFASCVVFNSGTRPMYCEIQADGQLYSGHVAFAYLNQWVPPGQYRYVNVPSPGPGNPLIAARANGRCRF